MATKKPTKEDEQISLDKKISEYVKEFYTWREDLKAYWPQMERNQEMYEFYRTQYEQESTDSQVSLNTPFAIIESQIAKENQAGLTVTVKAKGEDGLEVFEEWVSSVVTDMLEDPDVADIHGTFRKAREMWRRQLKIAGNSVAEQEYCYKTAIVNGKKKVVADNPYPRVISWKSIVFNPSMQFDSSDIYYVEEHTSLKKLKDNEVKEEDGKKSGLYSNLDRLKKALKDAGKLTDDEDISYIAGERKVTRKNEPIHIIKRWEGAKLTIIATTGKDSGIVIREVFDPFKTGTHNLLLGMRYKIEGRPYAYGELDAIYKPVKAQDTIMNQSIDIVNRFLRGSYVVDPASGIDLDAFMLLLERGGAMLGNPQGVLNVPVTQVPGQAFQTVEVLQQAVERAARFSPYSAGIPNQASDKTQGTKGGIMAMQSAAEPNAESHMDDEQEMFLRPYARHGFMMIANLMGDDEIRHSLLKGQDKQWIKLTKGIAQGSATAQDLLRAGFFTEEDVMELTTMEQPMLDEMGQPVLDPMTGEPQMQRIPIPGADKAFVFDIDWIIDVRLDREAESIKQEKAAKEVETIQLGMQMGVEFDPTRTITYIAKKQGFDNIEDLMLTPEEKMQKQQQEAMMQQEQAMQQQQQQEQQMQAKAQEGEAQRAHQMQLEAMKQQGGMAMAQMKQNVL